MQVRGLTNTQGALMIRSVGPFKRANLKQWIRFIANKPTNEVITDTALLNDLAKQGYYPDYDPASFFDVNQMWDALRDYDSGFNADSDYFYSDPHFSKAISLAFKLFGNFGDKIEPLVTESQLYKHIQLSSSAGLPTLKKKDEAFPTSYMRMKDVINGKKALNPCLAQFRTQRKKDANGIPVGKTRNVFAYPLDATLLETKYFYPLQKKYLSRRTPYAGGLTRSSLGARLTSTLRKKYIYEFDYSRYDASIPRGLIRVCFEIFRTWFAESEQRNITTIFQYFVNTPIVMPDGNLYVGKAKGVPSGSCFTQLVDSIVNFILTIAIGERFNLGINWYESHFVGDDSIFTSDRFVPVDVISRFAANFGFTINASKSRVINSDQRFHFVGFYFKNGLMTKDLGQVLSSLVYSERYRSYENRDEHLLSMYREIGLLSLDSVQLLRKKINSYNHGDFIECLTLRPNQKYATGYLSYRDKYFWSRKEKINFLSGQYLT